MIDIYVENFEVEVGLSQTFWYVWLVAESWKYVFGVFWMDNLVNWLQVWQDDRLPPAYFVPSLFCKEGF